MCGLRSHNQGMEPRAGQLDLRDAAQQWARCAAGGRCVRDILLKRAPADYDVATDATPEEVMALFPDSVRRGTVWRYPLCIETG